jgi:hypothetical protein
MAKPQPQPEVPDNLKSLATAIVGPVTSSDVDTYGKLREIEDRSHQVRTIIKAWKDQQTQDRRMREQYARWLMLAMAAQAFIINVVYVLMGCGVLNFEAWTARTFIMAVFGEIAALMLLVVKYLYTPSSEKILSFLGERPKKKDS